MDVKLAEPVTTASAAPKSEEEQRSYCLQKFNDYWLNVREAGVPFDTVGTMTLTATLFGLVSKHGEDMSAEFLEDMAAAIRNGEFSEKETPNG